MSLNNKPKVRSFVSYTQTLLTGVIGAFLSVTAHSADITGAGSTFAAPIYTKWASAYQRAGGGTVSYRGVGSTEGVKEIMESQVDFAGSDAPLSDDELARNDLLQFPMVIGGVVPVVNLPGIKPGELVLSGRVLGDIYLGKIISWNAPAIAAINPGLKLPDAPIAVVRRLDGSGTSLIWTHYLAQVNPEWKSRVGEGSSVRWPRGIGGRGNEGVATFVQHLPGAIGYVAWDFTKQNHMSYTAMENAAGTVVQPGPETFKAAAASADWSRSLVPMLTNEPGANAWPVVGATYVLLHGTLNKPERGEATLKFLDWALTNGDQAAEDLDYIPLPPAVGNEVRAQLHARVRNPSGGAVAGQ
jgi:phosphate transport system substrate-binding protein